MNIAYHLYSEIAYISLNHFTQRKNISIRLEPKHFLDHFKI